MSELIFNGLSSEEIFHLKEIINILMYNNIGLDHEDGDALVNYGKREVPKPIIGLSRIKVYIPAYIYDNNFDDEGPLYKNLMNWCNEISKFKIDGERVFFINVEPNGRYTLGSNMSNFSNSISNK